MALTGAQKTRIGELYYFDCKVRRGLTDYAVALELMTIILNNPSSQHTTQITNFLNARKADSEAVEAAAPDVSTATIAAENTLQAELTTLVGAL
jgi:hypothetical protein